ncbi:MAG: lysophospholipid acyltransferase family protein [Verrucomicrobiota bacterium]
MMEILGQWTHFFCNQIVSKTWGLFILLVARLRVMGMCQIPKGPYILVCNHISHFDPTTITAFYPRKIDFMADQEFFSHPFLHFFFWACDVFFVQRGKVDVRAVRETLRRLKQGRIVGMFPEGGIRSGKNSVLEGAPLNAGASALAQMANVPVRVCMVIGTDQLYCWKNLFRRVPIYLQCGPELKIDVSLPHHQAREKLNRDIEITFQKMYQDFLEKFRPEKEILPCEAQERWRNER